MQATKLAVAGDEREFVGGKHRAIASAVQRIGRLVHDTIKAHIGTELGSMGVEVSTCVLCLKNGEEVSLPIDAADAALDCDAHGLKHTYSRSIYPRDIKQLQSNPDTKDIVTPAIQCVTFVKRGERPMFVVRIKAGLEFGKLPSDGSSKGPGAPDSSLVVRVVTFTLYTCSEEEFKTHARFSDVKGVSHEHDFEHTVLAEFFTNDGELFAKMGDLIDNNIQRFCVAVRARHMCEAGLFRMFFDHGGAQPRLSAKTPDIPVKFTECEKSAENRRGYYTKSFTLVCTLRHSPGVYMRLRLPGEAFISEASEEEEQSKLTIIKFATAKEFFEWGLAVCPAKGFSPSTFPFPRPPLSIFNPSTWFQASADRRHLLLLLERAADALALQ